MMLSLLVGLTAMVVSLCGAVPSQSVLTLADGELVVVQIGLGGFLMLETPTVPSPLLVRGPTTPFRI
jgi:hypothetical protein